MLLELWPKLPSVTVFKMTLQARFYVESQFVFYKIYQIYKLSGLQQMKRKNIGLTFC